MCALLQGTTGIRTVWHRVDCSWWDSFLTMIHFIMKMIINIFYLMFHSTCMLILTSNIYVNVKRNLLLNYTSKIINFLNPGSLRMRQNPIQQCVRHSPYQHPIHHHVCRYQIRRLLLDWQSPFRISQQVRPL